MLISKRNTAHWLLFFMLSTFYTLEGFSQNLDPGRPEKISKTSNFKLEMEYISNNVYLGRADSNINPSLSSVLGYHSISGLYGNATVNYLPNNAISKLDNGAAELGYEFSFNDNFGGSVSFSKQFYAPNSTSVKSAISSTMALSLNYNIADILSPTLDLEYSVNKSGIPGDFLLNLGLAHDFAILSLFGEEDNLSLSPSLNFNMGSQNFYKSYLLRSFKSKAVQAQFTKAVNALAPFQALDYELSLPLVYTTGKFSFSLTPIEAIAINKLPKKILAQYANTNNLFYVDFGIDLKF